MGAAAGGGSRLKGVLWLLSVVVGGVPERVIGPLAELLGWFWWSVLRVRRPTVQDNLAGAFPSSSPAERARLGRRSVQHLARTFLEVLRIPVYARSGFANVEVSGMERLGRAIGEGRGALVLSGHLGSFELAMAAAARRAPAPVSVVVKRFSPGVDGFVTGRRTSAGLRVIDAAGAIGPVQAALLRNEIVIFVLDQNATRRTGVFVDFFGRTACTMRVLATLALRTKAPVLPAIPRRNADGTHRLAIGAPVPFDFQAGVGPSIHRMTQVYTARLERAICDAPTQWLWTHRRYRTRPRVSAR